MTKLQELCVVDVEGDFLAVQGTKPDGLARRSLALQLDHQKSEEHPYHDVGQHKTILLFND
jgi:hypothetical protein